MSEEQSKGSKVSTMKNGEYVLHVLVETAKQLQLEGYPQFDPLVKVRFRGIEKKTSAKENQSQLSIVKWDEHIFIETGEVTAKEIESSTIEIEVENKGFFSGDQMGYFPIASTTIYNLKDHALFNQPLSLTCPNAEDKSKPTGYLTVSINLTGPGDETAELKIGSLAENDVKEPWTTPNLKKVFKQYYFKFLQATDLPRTDLMGSIDSYIFYEQSVKAKLRTKTIPDDLTPKWRQEFLIPIEYPSTWDTIDFQLFDHNAATFDEQVAVLTFSIKQLDEQLENVPSILQWYNLYGSAVGCTNEAAKEQKSDFQKATYYRGKVLIEIRAQVMDQPMLKVQDVEKCDKYFDERIKRVIAALKGKPIQDPYCESSDEEDKIKHSQAGGKHKEKDAVTKKQPKPDKVKLDDKVDVWKTLEDFLQIKSKYQLLVHFGTAFLLPESEDYEIDFILGDVKLQADHESLQKSKSKGNYEKFCRWSKTVTQDFESVYHTVEELPLFFFYLTTVPGGFKSEGEKISFYRDKISKYQDPNMQLKWINFAPDKAIDKVSHEKAGMFSYKIYIKKISNDSDKIDFKTSKEYSKNWFPEQKRQFINIMRAYIYQARNLIAMDESGTSDPYVELYGPHQDDNDEKGKKLRLTQVQSQTNNPLFYHTCQFVLEFFDINDAPPVILTFFDTDESAWGLSSESEYMGRAVISIQEMIEKKFIQLQHGKIQYKDYVPQPEWFPVKFNQKDDHDTEVDGMVLCSFTLHNYDEQYKLYVPTEHLKLYKPPNPKDFKIPPNYMPDLQIEPYRMKINVLGLRNLVSGGLLPVKKAFVKFSVKSLLPSELAKAVNDILTVPNEAGEDPNIRTGFEIIVDMPSDPFYVPSMTCTVFDKIYFEGMAQPILGTFTLKCGKILAESRKQDADVIKKLEELSLTIQAAIDNRKQHPEQKIGDIINQTLQRKLTMEKAQSSWSAIGAAKKEQSLIVKDKKNLTKFEEMQIQKQEYLQKQKEEEEQNELQRLEGQQKMLSSNKDGNQQDTNEIVLWPKYTYDEYFKMDIEREQDKPDESMFMEIGYDPVRPESDEKRVRHYRKYFTKPLEKVEECMGEKSVFLEEIAYRTKPAEKGGFFSSSSQALPNKPIPTGKFKGLIQIYNETRKAMRQKKIDEGFHLLGKLIKEAYKSQTNQEMNFDFDWLDQFNEKSKDKKPRIALAELNDYLNNIGLGQLNVDEFWSSYLFQKNLVNQLKEQKQGLIRVYMLEGINFKKLDLFSESDPYLVLKCGKKEFNERDNYQLDEPNPKFYKSYEFIENFPGASVLTITAYDYDGFFGDDLIGFTKIDFDDRYYSKEWTSFVTKPIEYRNLYNTTSTVSQGQIKLWVEIIGMENKRSALPPINIDPEPLKEFEVRLVIWKSDKLDTMDWEGTSDAYVRSYLDSDHDQMTDTHWRCQTGQASWNWRNKITAKSKQKDYSLTIEAWDKDLIGGDELIGQFILDIEPIFKEVYITNKIKPFTKQLWDKRVKGILKERQGDKFVDLKWETSKEEEEQFWIPIKRIQGDKDAKDFGKEHVGGYLMCSLRIYPMSDAKKFDQGKGRDAPNNDPFMPEPEGRIKLTLNPFEMFNQLVGPAVRRKIYYWCYCAACIALCIFMAPMVISNGFSKLLFG